MSQAALWGHGESAAMGTDMGTPALPRPWAAAAMAQAELGPVGLQGLRAQHLFHPRARSAARPRLGRQISHISAVPLYLG